MPKIDRNILISILKNYENLEELLHYYSDKNLAFQSVVDSMNAMKNPKKFQKLKNERHNRRIISYYAEKILQERALTDGNELPSKIIDYEINKEVMEQDILGQLIPDEIGSVSTDENNISNINIIHERTPNVEDKGKLYVSQEHSYCSLKYQTSQQDYVLFLNESIRCPTDFNTNIEISEISELEWNLNSDCGTNSFFSPEIESTKISKNNNTDIFNVSQEHSYCSMKDEAAGQDYTCFLNEKTVRSPMDFTNNMEIAQISELEWDLNRDCGAYTLFSPEIESTKVSISKNPNFSDVNSKQEYMAEILCESQQMQKYNENEKSSNGMEINISSLCPKKQLEGSNEETIDAKLPISYRNPKSSQEKPNRSIRMVKNMKEVHTKKPSFKDCKYKDCTFHCENVHDVVNKNDIFSIKKILQDYLRETYDNFNNVCDLNIHSSKFNEDRTIYTMYAYCNDSACCTFIFRLNFANKNCEVFRSKEELRHQIGNHKCYQNRGPKRHVLKAELLKKKAVLYRKEAINRQSRFLRLIGKQQDVRPIATIRKVRSEAMGHFDYDKHPFIDTFIMSETNYEHFIQHLATPLRVYLFSKERLEMLHKYDALLAQKADYTMRIDATGGIIEPIKCAQKRVFLYSIVTHFSDSNKIFPVADAILSTHTTYEISLFLHMFKDAMKENNRRPICRRIVTDCSYAIINAILAEFNGIFNIQDYLIKCHCFLQSASKKLDFIVIQFCTSHYTKIICKDIDERVPLKNVKLREFLRESIGLAFNFTTLQECKDWFEMMSIILSGQYLNSQVSKVINKFMVFAKTPIEENLIKEESGKTYLQELRKNTLDEIANSSPFTSIFKNILLKIETMDLFEIDGLQNPFYCPEFLEFMLKKYIAFLPFWTNIIGYHVCFKKERVSNGPIEAHYKNVKHLILKGEKHKLGRAIRKIEKYYRSITTDVEAIYFDEKILETIKPETKIKSSKGNRMLKSPKVFGKDSNRDMKKATESWNKKGKLTRLKQPMFNKEFSSLQKISEKITKLQTERYSIQSDHKYAQTCLLKMPEYNPYDIFSMQTLTKFNQDRLFICNLKTVYDEYFVGQVFEDNVLSLFELETLRPRQWLRNNIVNAGLAILLKENGSNYRGVPVQIDSYCFKNRIILQNALQSCLTSILIPQLISSHYYLVILNMETKEVSCLDPKQYNRTAHNLISHYIKEIQILRNEVWSVKTFVFDKQFDDVECGIFVLQYAERYIKNMEMTKLDLKPSYRQQMLKKLLNYSSKLICLHCSTTKSTEIECLRCSKRICSGCIRDVYHKHNIKTITCKLCEYENSLK